MTSMLPRRRWAKSSTSDSTPKSVALRSNLQVSCPILHRYWKRIVANLAGIVTSAIEPIQSLDYLDAGRTDIDD